MALGFGQQRMSTVDDVVTPIATAAESFCRETSVKAASLIPRKIV